MAGRRAPHGPRGAGGRIVSILRGFGFTFDIATGRNRQWYVDEHGVRHYLDEQPASLNELSGESGQFPTHPQEGDDA